MDNFTRTLINGMARQTGTTLSVEHWKILEYVWDYYAKHKVGPLFQNIGKHTGATRKDIEKLFPHGLGSVYAWVGIPVQSTESGCKPMAFVQLDELRNVYLDYNATTPIRKEVVKYLKQYMEDPLGFGNPSSSTSLGRKAHEALQTARNQVADCLRTRPDNIVFTGSGSEANNMAIKSIASQHLSRKGHIISSAIEHASVLKPLRYLQESGFEVSFAEVDREGLTSPRAVHKHIRENTILVCVMAANNEIGAINPIGEIGKICLTYGIPFMVDAIQAFGKIPLNPGKMGISLLSVSGHKIYAPKGVGALYIDQRLSLTPLIHGGGQEFGLRAGTENVGSIAALGLASVLIHREMEEENKRLIGLRDYFLKELVGVVPNFIVNGSLQNRLPNNLSIGFPDIDSGSLLLSLNQAGIYVSSGSACSSGSTEASHVLREIGTDTENYGVIRFSFGLLTTKEDIDYLLKYLPAILENLK